MSLEIAGNGFSQISLFPFTALFYDLWLEADYAWGIDLFKESSNQCFFLLSTAGAENQLAMISFNLYKKWENIKNKRLRPTFFKFLYADADILSETVSSMIFHGIEYPLK